MIIDQPRSWYIFLFSKKCSYCPSDPGAYIMYKGKRLTNKEYLEHWGKWVFFGEKEELDELAEKLDPFVESEEIPCIKYDRSPQKWFNLEQCVMCVYCDDRQRDEVFKILAKFGIKGKRWAPEMEVIQKWMPGGLNLERWLAFHNVSDEEGEKIRKDAKKKFEETFLNRPNDICFGWQQ
ncbi:MAG: hypothetical protein J7L16_06400 [Deltaproteobacteria bacterium]|nr:hypothetical protein [Deltaproteobacteria bacterium]